MTCPVKGSYQGVDRRWLRWYDRDGNWLPTPAELEQQRADQEKKRADAAEQDNARLRERLRQAGLEP